MARTQKQRDLLKNRRINISVTESLYDTLHAEARLAGVSLPEYIRNRLSKREVTLTTDYVLDSTVVNVINEQLSRVGNNLNQIAHWYNRWQIPDNDMEQNLRELIVTLYRTSEKLTSIAEGVDNGCR
jgi:predicted HTH domain antitoxin